MQLYIKIKILSSTPILLNMFYACGISRIITNMYIYIFLKSVYVQKTLSETLETI